MNKRMNKTRAPTTSKKTTQLGTISGKPNVKKCKTNLLSKNSSVSLVCSKIRLAQSRNRLKPIGVVSTQGPSTGSSDDILPFDITMFDVSTVQHKTLEEFLDGMNSAKDFAACRRFISTNISNPSTILHHLNNIIESSTDLDMCGKAINILNKIVVEANKQKAFPFDEIFVNYKNVNNLVDALPRLEIEFGNTTTYQECHADWSTKALQIVNIMWARPNWKNKVKYLKSDTIEYLGDMVSRKSRCKGLVDQLLTTIKIVCTKRNNCQYLTKPSFYHGLCNAFDLTRRIITITFIFESSGNDNDDKSVLSGEVRIDTAFGAQVALCESIPDMSCFYKEILKPGAPTIHVYTDYTPIGGGLCKRYVITNYYRIETKPCRYSKIDYLAYPDAIMMEPNSYDELVTHQQNDSFTLPLSEKIRRILESVKPSLDTELAYDLDMLYRTNAPLQIIDFVTPISTVPDLEKGLLFESRFESGNLRRAIRVGQYEYDLILSPDTFSTHGVQWYYFEIANMTANVPYIFNIVNFIRPKNSYLDGMRPLMFSVLSHRLNNIGWKRTTGPVYYYSNHYISQDGAKHYSLSFTVTFQYSCDYVYFAYHYPYTYTRLMRMLSVMSEKDSETILMKVDKLCNSINNLNDVPIVTITSKSENDEKGDILIRKRPIIFLTARVHPGESNSSWIMEGIIQFLLNETDENAITARNHFIFKIVPMLNPEGVICGNTRFSLNGVDLNRTWDNPSKEMCPEIYNTKLLIAYAKFEMKHPISAFVDIHGHSTKKLFFLFGCNPKNSWCSKDKVKGDWSNVLKIIPSAINLTNPNFQMESCTNVVAQQKESTARVVVWRDFNVVHSFTLECSYSEFSNKLSVSTSLLVDIGISVVTAFAKIAKSTKRKRQVLPSLCLDYTDVKITE